MRAASSGISIAPARSTAWQNAVPWEKLESPEILSARNTARVNRHALEELLGALVRVEHAQLQIENWFARYRETEMAGLDDSGVNRSDGNLKDTFAQRGPVHVALALKLGKNRSQAEVLPQRMNIRPVVVQCNAARDWDDRRVVSRTYPGFPAPASSTQGPRPRGRENGLRPDRSSWLTAGSMGFRGIRGRGKRRNIPPGSIGPRQRRRPRGPDVPLAESRSRDRLSGIAQL